MTDLTIEQRLGADRDASMNASDERYLARLAQGLVVQPEPAKRNAMLQRDQSAMVRSSAALRRFGRTPQGRRAASI